MSTLEAVERSKRGRSNRNKGAVFERQVAAWLVSHGFPDAERGARNGWKTAARQSADPFDIVGTPGLLWSLKHGGPSYTSEPACARYLDEVHETAWARNYQTGLLVVKRSGVADIGASWCHRKVATLTYPDGPWIQIRTTLADMLVILRNEGFGHPQLAAQ